MEMSVFNVTLMNFNSCWPLQVKCKSLVLPGHVFIFSDVVVVNGVCFVQMHIE